MRWPGCFRWHCWASGKWRFAWPCRTVSALTAFVPAEPPTCGRRITGSPSSRQDATRFWRVQPTLHDLVWDFTPVTTNAQGLRMDRPVGPKPANGFRIVCVGDSVTFGYRVPTAFIQNPTATTASDKPYRCKLQDWLQAANPDRAIEVIPLAVPGYNQPPGPASGASRTWPATNRDAVTILFGRNDCDLRPIPDARSMPDTAYPSCCGDFMMHSQALLASGTGLAQPCSGRGCDSPGRASIGSGLCP